MELGWQHRTFGVAQHVSSNLSCGPRSKPGKAGGALEWVQLRGQQLRNEGTVQPHFGNGNLNRPNKKRKAQQKKHCSPTKGKTSICRLAVANGVRARVAGRDGGGRNLAVTWSLLSWGCPARRQRERFLLPTTTRSIATVVHSFIFSLALRSGHSVRHLAQAWVDAARTVDTVPQTRTLASYGSFSSRVELVRLAAQQPRSSLFIGVVTTTMRTG